MKIFVNGSKLYDLRDLLPAIKIRRKIRLKSKVLIFLVYLFIPLTFVYLLNFYLVVEGFSLIFNSVISQTKIINREITIYFLE